MRILFINKFFFRKGGAERVFFQERESFIKSGHEVYEFAMHSPNNEDSAYSDFFVDNVDYHALHKKKAQLRIAHRFIHNGQAVRNIKRLLAMHKPDIAHLHNIYHQITPSIIPVLKDAGIPIVLTSHDAKLVCPSYLMVNDGKICTACIEGAYWNVFTKSCYEGRGKRFLLGVEAYWHFWNKSYENVDVFISPSSFYGGLIAKRISAKKVQVIHNGIEIEQYVPKFSGDGYIVYLGRISHEKGIATLCRAHELIGRSIPLKIIGDGPLLPELMERYPSIEFIGYKSGAELSALVRNSDFVVIPSEWYENCSMAVLEAMAYGKPVVGSRIGGIPEQIQHGISGLLFTPGDSEDLALQMESLIENTDLRVVMGREARKKVEREYSLQNHCRQLERLYRDLIS